MSHHNHPDIFPNLRGIRLEALAHTWAKRFPFIKSISLYHKPDDIYNFPVKYIMFFELSEDIKKDRYEEYNGQFAEKLAGSNVLVWLGEARPDDFQEVYKDKPHENFLVEWRFVTKRPEDVVIKHSWILFSRTDEEKTTEQENTKIFPFNPKTKWEQIEMSLLPAGDKFMIKSPLGRGYYDHIDLKLNDKRTKSERPNDLWKFLKILARMDGFFSLQGVEDYEELSSKAKRLDWHLKQLFGINERSYKDRCNKIGGYKTKFKISQIPDDNFMVDRKPLIDEELEDSKYSAIKESSFYPEHSTFEKK
jgi:hypothetical protein